MNNWSYTYTEYEGRKSDINLDKFKQETELMFKQQNPQYYYKLTDQELIQILNMKRNDYEKPIQKFSNKYNRGISDEEKLRLLCIKYSIVNNKNLKFMDIGYKSVGSNIFNPLQTMDNWVFDLNTNKYYWFEFENLDWHSSEESKQKLNKYGLNYCLVKRK